MRIFKFRPHHLICNICFRGKGYNENFVQNFQAIHNELKESFAKENIFIQIINHCDDICAFCPENNNGICISDEKVRTIDNLYLKILHLKINQIVIYNNLQDSIKKLLTLKNFQHACNNCSWYEICLPIMQEFVNN